MGITTNKEEDTKIWNYIKIVFFFVYFLQYFVCAYDSLELQNHINEVKSKLFHCMITSVSTTKIHSVNDISLRVE